MLKKLLFKTGISYLILCLLAYGYYWIGVTWLGFDISSGDKIQTLSMSLWGWTATMITPIAAFFALDGWREQQKAINISNAASETLHAYESFKTPLILLGAIVSRVREKEKLNSEDSEIMLVRIKQTSLPSFELSNKMLKFALMAEQERDMKYLFDLHSNMQLGTTELMNTMNESLYDIEKYKLVSNQITGLLNLGDTHLSLICRKYILFK